MTILIIECIQVAVLCSHKSTESSFFFPFQSEAAGHLKEGDVEGKDRRRCVCCVNRLFSIL